MNIGEVLDTLREAGVNILDAAKTAAAEAGVAAETWIVDSMFGRVGEEFVRQAEAWPADLIILGMHGRRGVSKRRRVQERTPGQQEAVSPRFIPLAFAGVA